MKTINQKHFVRLSNCLLLSLFCTGVFSCSKKNDTPDPFITIEQAKTISTDVNGCYNGNRTLFDFEISYKTSPGILIVKVEDTWEQSNGSKGKHEIATASDGKDGNITKGLCIRFDSSTWSKNTFMLISSTGLKSNPFVLQIDKPAGAK